MLTATFRKSKGQEEANIYYVAATRAKKTLVFVE
jgi:ATP-dependent exoDNAse (exonuclease V) beta subunit